MTTAIPRFLLEKTLPALLDTSIFTLRAENNYDGYSLRDERNRFSLGFTLLQ